MTSEGESLVPETPPEPPVAVEPGETRFLKWLVFGNEGVRAGWSVALFLVIFLVTSGILQLILLLAVAKPLHIDLQAFTPSSALLLEVAQLLPILAAALVCAMIERRRILDYNLRGEHRLRHFCTGLVGGMAALSVLIAALRAGGWLHFGAASLSGAQIVEYGALWGLAFLLTGFTEEGSVRCYLLFTLTRGVNYWWALGTVSTLSLFAWLNGHGNGSMGVYAMAALGVLPCLVLELKKSPSASFWQASWLTSTLFGYIHTFNAGESSIGIFSASWIGFVFCASIRLTGSAWWAIGFHAAWDWAQTFFYGTADSGLIPTGHFLSTSPAGPALWSGASAGPEGSLLVIPVVLLVLILLVAIYGRRIRTESASSPAQAQLS